MTTLPDGYLTEKQAKKKPCPETKNRKRPLKCDASECIWWRWKKTGLALGGAVKDHVGYCGAGGKP